MKLVTIQLNVISELTDEFEVTEVVVSHIQAITDSRIDGQHILSTIRLKGTERELLVWESEPEIRLAIDYADVPHDKRPIEYWDRLQAIIGDPTINRNHNERKSYENETHTSNDR
jgi:hypothetical protein